MTVTTTPHSTRPTHRTPRLLTRPRARFAPRERGSILLMVLALLSILLLLALSLTYISKLEIRAADNAARGVQARMNTARKMDETLTEMSTVPLASANTANRSRYSPPASSVWATTPSTAFSSRKNVKGVIPEERRVGIFAVVRPEFQNWLEESEARDQCALLNPNVIRDTAVTAQQAVPGSQRLALFAQNGSASAATLATGSEAPIADSITITDFERFVANRFNQKRVTAANPGAMATALVKGSPVDPNERRRNRFTNKIMQSSDDQQLNQNTPGNSSNNNEAQRRPFTSLSELRTLPGMTPSAFRVLAPLMTTASTSPEVWRAANGDAFVRVPMNTATPQQIFNALELLYLTAEKDLLRQIAVNIVDRRDPDSIPTLFPNSSNLRPIIGVELGVFISEVYPDSKSLESQNDNGEYIELHNPLARSVSVAGWRLDWGNGSAALSGSIAPGGTLLLTDDINDLADPSPNTDGLNIGSFYDIFHVVASRENRIAQEKGMEIPNDSGTIRLLDNQGHLIDYLVYSNARFNGINRGFAKPYPFSREALPAVATPLQHRLSAPSDPHQRACWDQWVARMDTPFRSCAEALAVPALSSSARNNTRPDDIFPLALISDTDQPDFRLLDLFTAADFELAFTDNDAPRPWKAEKAESGITPAQQNEQNPFPVAHGRINLNSASAEVLEVLPGIDSRVSFAITTYRAEMRRQGERRTFDSLAAFANTNEVWNGSSASQRLDALLRICPLATVYSATYYVTATHRLPVADEEGEAPNNGLSSAALVNLVPTGVDVLHWDYLRLAETPVRR